MFIATQFLPTFIVEAKKLHFNYYILKCTQMGL